MIPFIFHAVLHCYMLWLFQQKNKNIVNKLITFGVTLYTLPSARITTSSYLVTVDLYVIHELQDQSSPNFVQTSAPTQGRFLKQVWCHQPVTLPWDYSKPNQINGEKT